MKQDPLHRLELIISHLLRAGVLLAGLLLAIGWLWMLKGHGDVLDTFRQYHPRSLSSMIETARTENDYGVLISIAGLAILVLLPITRVLMTAVLFIKQKDYVLALMGFLVFSALAFSFLLGVEI